MPLLLNRHEKYIVVIWTRIIIAKQTKPGMSVHYVIMNQLSLLAQETNLTGINLFVIFDAFYL